MLEMNKQKQQEIKGFLGWLEGYVGAKVEDMSPKTKIQAYYDHDYEDFLDVLKKNKRKLSINPSGREASELLKDEFGKSVGKLQPLRERIERTDQLIDDIVYRLYGLNEEEIRVVGGEHRKEALTIYHNPSRAGLTRNKDGTLFNGAQKVLCSRCHFNISRHGEARCTKKE